MRDHEADDLTARGGLMVARAVAGDAYEAEMRRQVALSVEHCAHVGRKISQSLMATSVMLEEIANIRTLSASDAALARAIDAVPGVASGPDALVIRSNGAHERI